LLLKIARIRSYKIYLQTKIKNKKMSTTISSHDSRNTASKAWKNEALIVASIMA